VPERERQRSGTRQPVPAVAAQAEFGWDGFVQFREGPISDRLTRDKLQLAKA
jgi:hypothetical protein